MMKAMLLRCESFGLKFRNLSFRGAKAMLLLALIRLADDAAYAAGLYVVEPLAVVAHAAARARLHEF